MLVRSGYCEKHLNAFGSEIQWGVHGLEGAKYVTTLCLSRSVGGMSDEELQEKALGVAKHTLSGKSDLERATVLHQHIGRRAMGDMVIETFEPSPGEDVRLLNCTPKLLISVPFPPAVNKVRKWLRCVSVYNHFKLQIKEEGQAPAFHQNRRA